MQSFTKWYSDQIKGSEIHTWVDKCKQFYSVNPKEEDHLEDLDFDGRIIFK
jgi:hypothetical protein